MMTTSVNAIQFKTLYNPFTSKLDYYSLYNGSDNLAVNNLNVSGTVTGITLGTTFNNENITLFLGVPNVSIVRAGNISNVNRSIVSFGCSGITQDGGAADTDFCTDDTGSGADPAAYNKGNFTSNLNSVNDSISLWNKSSTNMFQRNIGDKVGIGTTTPNTSLHMNQNVFLHTINGSLPLVGGLDLGATTGLSTFALGDVAFAGANPGAAIDELTIIDISNKSTDGTIRAKKVSGMDLGVGVNDITAIGTTAILGLLSTNNALLFVDFTNISSPKNISKVDFGTVVYSVDIAGKDIIAGIGNVGNNARIIDFSDIYNPKELSQFASGNDVTAVKVRGNWVAIGLKQNGGTEVRLYDITNRKSPVLIGEFELGAQNALSLVFKENNLIVGTSTGSLITLNINNPSNPVNISEVDMGQGINSLSNGGDYVAAALNSIAGFEIRVFYFGNPSDPIFAGGFATGQSFDIHWQGRNIFFARDAGSEFQILDTGGLEIPAANIGTLKSQNLYVGSSATVNNNLYVNTGLNVGFGGILSQGNIYTPRLGVNATAPVQTLQVLGTVNITSQNTRDGDLFVASSGAVGINNPNPIQKLDVLGNVSFTGNVTLGTSQADDNYRFKVLGNINITGEVAYGTLRAQSPHALIQTGEKGELEPTEICLTTTNRNILSIKFNDAGQQVTSLNTSSCMNKEILESISYKVDNKGYSKTIYQINNYKKVFSNSKRTTNETYAVEYKNYECISKDLKTTCPHGFSGGLGTRCYQDMNKTTYYLCSEGWV